MTRVQFVKKWGSRFPPPREEFERDVEALVRSSTKAAISATSRAVKIAARKCSEGSVKETLVVVANEMIQAVESALLKM